VPDAAVFKGDLDQMREVAEQEQPESEPKADAIRGTAAIIRRFSLSRQKMEQEEARRLREDKMKDQLEPLRENEVVEWDGLRRRKTIIGNAEFGGPVRRKTIHPPLGMSHFPEQAQNEESEREAQENHSFFEGLRGRAQSVLHPHQQRNTTSDYGDPRSPIHPMALTEINVQGSKAETPILPYGPGSFEEAQEHIYGLPPGLQGGRNQSGTHSPRSKPLPKHPQDQSPAIGSPKKDSLAPERPEHSARRQFSFTNVFHRNSKTPERPNSSDPNYTSTAAYRPTSRAGIGSRSASSTSHEQKRAMKTATEEERLGLVKGDSHAALLQEEHSPPRPTHSQSSSSASDSFLPYDLKPSNYVHNPLSEDDEDDDWQMMNPRSGRPSQSPPQRLPQHEQSQPPFYQPPSPPRRILGQSRAAVDSSQTSTRNPATNLPPAPYEYPSRTDEGPIARTGSPEDYEKSKRRFMQERARDRGPNNDSGGGTGGTGATGAFI
jgi:hypothetical protein